jgi:glycosyltransferase involved in cell wall biosynthesis
MPPDANADVVQNIDRLVLNGSRVFGWGWAAHPSIPVAAVHLRVAGADGDIRIPADYGLSREDVEQAHPGLVGARASGFIVTGYAKSPADSRMTLEVDFADGTRSAIDVSARAERLYEKTRKRRMVSWLARSVWRRLARGDFAGILRRAKAQRLSAPALDDAGIVDELIPHLAGARRVLIVFDHAMGGGANHYRERIVAARLAQGDAVVVCTYNLPTLDYRLQLLRAGAEPRVWRASTFVALENVLLRFEDAELFVNSPVSFDEPLLLADWLARVRLDYPRSRLTVTAHDYFAVCPSFVLLDADGRYCGIPHISRCNDCLKRHEASFVALSPPTEMGAWRALWGRCLAAADEVRCFSEASRKLLLHAYPRLDPARLTVVPHAIDFVPARRPTPSPAGPLVVGVVGEISYQKGAQVVEQMIDRIEGESLDVRVVVIGLLHSARKSPRLRVTGPYEREHLVDLIEAHGVNVLFFPSIWPETFSYVVGEMMTLGLPIVAFDLGAPAERLRAYPLARLAARADGSAALDEILALRPPLPQSKVSA